MSNLDRIIAEGICGFTVNKEHAPYVWSVPLDSQLYGLYDGLPLKCVPGFSARLDLCAEAESRLSEDQQAAYGLELARVLGLSDTPEPFRHALTAFKFATAPASARAKALAAVAGGGQDAPARPA